MFLACALLLLLFDIEINFVINKKNNMSAVIGVLGLLLTEALCSSKLYYKSMIMYLTYSRVADYAIGLFLLDSLCVSNKVQQWSRSQGGHGPWLPQHTP